MNPANNLSRSRVCYCEQCDPRPRCSPFHPRRLVRVRPEPTVGDRVTTPTTLHPYLPVTPTRHSRTHKAGNGEAHPWHCRVRHGSCRGMEHSIHRRPTDSQQCISAGLRVTCRFYELHAQTEQSFAQVVKFEPQGRGISLRSSCFERMLESRHSVVPQLACRSHTSYSGPRTYLADVHRPTLMHLVSDKMLQTLRRQHVPPSNRHAAAAANLSTCTE